MRFIKYFLALIRRNPFRLMNIFINKRNGIRGFSCRKKFTSLDDLLCDHFENNSMPTHPCRGSLELALRMLNEKSARIIETGSSAWGANSSLLFDSYVNSFGGDFSSVDIRISPMIHLSETCTNRSRFYCDDSVNFLKRSTLGNISLVYLDSWDVDWANPLPSVMHGFNEFMQIVPLLSEGSLLLIDDTPKDSHAMNLVHPDYLDKFLEFQDTYGFAPGKGALVLNYLRQFSSGELIAHEYQLLWKF